MGDVDALCKRIVIIDKGKMLYDNDMQHLKSFFGSYRTLKLRIIGDPVTQHKTIKDLFPDLETGIDEGWISILIDEDKTSVMKVLNTLQQSMKIRDMQIEEISTEDVIRKIYEGGVR